MNKSYRKQSPIKQQTDKTQNQTVQQQKPEPTSNQNQQQTKAIDKFMQHLETEIPTQANEKGPSESIKQALTQLQKEPNLEQALTQIVLS